MPKVNSTAIERVRALTPNKFRVRFHGGREYDITAPRDVYRSLRHSRSVGYTYSTSIRGRYPTERVS